MTTRILMLILCLCAAVRAGAGPQVIEIATGEYPPFTSEEIEGHGSVNAFIARIAGQAGFDVVFAFLPWKRALETTRRGGYDASSFWYESDERAADFIHVGPVLEDRLVFFRRADTAVGEWASLADLAGYTIGAVTGYTYTPEFWALAESGVLSVEVAPTDEANLRKLLSGRIDLYPMSEETGRYLIARIASEDEARSLAVLETPLSVTEGYLLVARARPGAEAIAARLQDALDALGAREMVKPGGLVGAPATE